MRLHYGVCEQLLHPHSLQALAPGLHTAIVIKLGMTTGTQKQTLRKRDCPAQPFMELHGAV